MQSFRNLAQLSEFKEWKIFNNLVIKYNKLIISNITNLRKYLVKQVYNN